MQELKHEIIVKGSPKISNLSKDESKVFYNVLLNQMLEHFKEKSTDLRQDKCVPLGTMDNLEEQRSNDLFIDY